MNFTKCKEFPNVFFDDQGNFFTVKDGKDVPLESFSTKTKSQIVIKGQHYDVLYLILNATEASYTPYDRVTFKIGKSGFISPKSIKILKSPALDSGDDFFIFKYRCDTKANTANSRFKDKISASSVLQILKIAEFKCIYCGCDIDSNDWHLDHYHPKAYHGKNVIENLAPACRGCNMMKGAMHGRHFLKKCAKICVNNKIFTIEAKQNLSKTLDNY